MTDQKKKEIPAGAHKFSMDVFEQGPYNPNDIDRMLKKELEEQGLEWRFVDFKKAMENGGWSRSGWYIYRRHTPNPVFAGIKGMDTADGLVRRGGDVLAVLPKKFADEKRKRRDEQNTHLNRYTESVTDEIGRQASGRLSGSKVLAGYDKNS